MHDISAVINPNDMLTYMRKNNLFIDESEIKYPFILHQRISRLIAKDFFNIGDKTILSAIECHTTLKPNPSQYDMSLFIADKLSWDQYGKLPFYDVVHINHVNSLYSNHKEVIKTKNILIHSVISFVTTKIDEYKIRKLSL